MTAYPNAIMPGINQPTRYEIAMTRNDGTSALLVYCGRNSGRGLRDAMYERSDAIVAFFGADPMETLVGTVNGNPRKVVVIGLGTIGYTGRTQRDAVGTKSELPFLGRLNRRETASMSC